MKGKKSSGGLTILLLELEKALKPSKPLYLPVPLRPTPPKGKKLLKSYKLFSFMIIAPLEVSLSSLL